MHVLQVVTVPSLNFASEPHLAGALTPVHSWPAGTSLGEQAAHEVRVVAPPPAVFDPAPHKLQPAAPPALKRSSAPHSEAAPPMPSQ